MAEKVHVFDAEGIARHVHSVDAREIVEMGGRLADDEAPVPEIQEKPKAIHPAEVGRAKAK